MARRLSNLGADSIEELEQFVRGELDFLVSPLRSPVHAGDEGSAMHSPQVAVDEGVSALRLVGRAVGEREMPLGVVIPPVRLEVGVLDWSRDGTKLLFLREDPTDDTFPYDRHLYILHADGTETQVVPEPVSAAALSPDGIQVVYAADASDGLYVVDADGGQPVRISAFGEHPTFSPDGTQIAFLGLPRSGCCVQAGREHVWVANTDGTDAHEILVNEPALDDGASGLTWSQGDDRIAMDNAREGHVAIYTFASDGSGFTQVVTGGAGPFWSPRRVPDRIRRA